MFGPKCFSIAKLVVHVSFVSMFWPQRASKLSISGPRSPAPGPGPSQSPTWSCTRYSRLGPVVVVVEVVVVSLVPPLLRALLSTHCTRTRFLSAFHGHSHVPWWSFLVPAPSINWRRRTPAHQDGSHSESRNPRAASVETLPIPCLQTHAILATAFLPVLPFPDPDDEWQPCPRQPAPHCTAIRISAIKHTCLAVAGSSSPAPRALESRSIRSASPFTTLSPPPFLNLPHSDHCPSKPSVRSQKPPTTASRGRHPPARIRHQHLCLACYLGVLRPSHWDPRLGSTASPGSHTTTPRRNCGTVAQGERRPGCPSRQRRCRFGSTSPGHRSSFLGVFRHWPAGLRTRVSSVYLGGRVEIGPTVVLMATNMMAGGFYMQYLDSLCQRRGWTEPTYECYRESSGYTCLVLVNGREYQTDLAYQSDELARENAAMRAFMVCRSFSVNNGMLARNGIVQGLPADEANRKHRKSSRHTSTASSHTHSHSHHARSRRCGHHSSGSSTTSYDC